MASNNNNNVVSVTFKAFNKAFNDSMKSMNAETAQLKAQMKLQQEQMKHSATETQKLEAKMQSLEQIYQSTQRQTQATADALNRAKALWGENSQEVAKYQQQLLRHQTAEAQAANAITETAQALARSQRAVQEQQDSMKRLQGLFDATGTRLRDFSDVLGQDLVHSITMGTASSRDLENAFNRVARSSLGAGADINEIRTVINRLDGQNIDEIRREIERLSEEANNAEQEVNKLGDAFNVLGGVVAGVGIAKVMEEALSASDLSNTIDIAFSVDEQGKENVRQALTDVKKYGIESDEALEGVRRQWALNADASDETNAKIVEGAAMLSKVYRELDFGEVVQELNEISGELGMTDEEALQLVNDLMKVGFPTNQIDIIAEYGQQLKRAGFEGEKLAQILASASLADSWNIDNLLDGIKEGRITATEMGRGLTDSFKQAIREVTVKTKAMSEEQLSIMSDGFTQQENALSKSLDKRMQSISKSHNKQSQALDKQMQNEYDSVSKAYDKQVDALEKRLSKEYDSVSKNYDKQQRELEKALSKELQEYEKATNEKIALIDKEYLEKMKLIDEEKYNQLKAIDEQIDALNAKTDIEDKAIKQRENNEKRADLQAKVRQAKTSKDRIEAQKELANFEEKLRLDAIREQRKDQIDTLKEQKDVIKDSSDAQKDAIKSELDEQKTKLKEQADAEKEAIKERQENEKLLFQEQKQAKLNAIKEANTQEINSLKAVNTARLNSLKEEQTARKEALNERMSNELEAVRESHSAQLESFKKMNAEKLEIAKNPPDTAETVAMFAQLEGWGKAIAKGGEEGSQAFEDMVRWLDTIEDATLRNAIGMEIFKTKWEDQGENLVETILGVDEATARLAETQTEVSDNVGKMGDENALVQFNQAIEDTKKALAPLMIQIAEIIGKIATWVSENPKLSATLLAIFSALGILIGGLAVLSPIVTMLIGLFGGGAGLSGIFAKIAPILLNLGSKVLPLLRVAFGALSGPIGWVILILTTVLPLIVKHWDSIVAFFVEIGTKIKTALEKPFNDFKKFVGDVWKAIRDKVKEWVDKVKGLLDFKETINKAKTKFGEIKDALINPIKEARDSIRDIIEKIKGFFNFKFEWPELKVPKIKITKGSLNPLKWFSEGFPEVDIEWFKDGGLMKRPTAFGRNGNRLMAGGEAGAEAIIPLNERVLASIGNAIYQASDKTQAAETHVYNYQGMLDGAIINVREDADIKKISRELFVLQQQKNRGGGRL